MEILAIVRRGNKTRGGKGFSRDELREVDINPRRALKLGIPVDLRRSTRHKENVELLRQFLNNLKKPSQTKAKPSE